MSLTDRVLVLRADSTAAVGAGHVMRLAALAESWRAAGGRVGLAGEITQRFVQDRIDGIGVEPWPLDGVGKADVLVVDTYHEPTRAQLGAEAAPRLRVLVDDVGLPVPAGYDVVWNPNPYPGKHLYPHFSGAVLEGPQHVPLRSTLPQWRRNGHDETMVSLGGGTPNPDVVDALQALSRLDHAGSFATTLARAPEGWRRIAPDAFWSEAATAARLVTAAGTTAWEAAAVGIPVVLLQTAPNQSLVYTWTRDLGVPAVNAALGDSEYLAQQIRVLLPAANPLPRLTDGSGRVVERLAALL
ncbi:MAG: hypothetical protein ABI647_07985 [Gemmatimonadota bacterium]